MEKVGGDFCSLFQELRGKISSLIVTFCTFLDASKAFDRVNYCKLFNIVVDRGLPPYIMRVIIKLYTSQQAWVSWSGCLSGYFAILNGVRQGGVLSPLLYCVYIDQLLLRLAQSGCGCFIGRNFVGALGKD